VGPITHAASGWDFSTMTICGRRTGQSAVERSNDWVYTGAVKIESGRIVRGRPAPAEEEVVSTVPRYPILPGGGSNVVVRRETFATFGGFDTPSRALRELTGVLADSLAAFDGQWPATVPRAMNHRPARLSNPHGRRSPRHRRWAAQPGVRPTTCQRR